MRTVRSVAAFLLALTALLALAVGLASGAHEHRAGREAASGQVTEVEAMGAELYAQSCASCHGPAGAGGEYGPSLRGVGAASVDFQLTTGRMPFAGQPGTQARRKPVAFSQEQIDSLVAYVVSLGGSQPSGPDIPVVTISDDLLPRGHEVFTANCAPCHGATGNGGAVGGGALAPPLDVTTPVQTVEAMLVGPGQMPIFAYAEEDLNAVATYVEWLQQAPTPGGFSIGGIGPVPEGFVAWVVGMGLLLVVVVLAGRSWQRTDAER